jgi:Protein of unknown function (DUF1279)
MICIRHLRVAPRFSLNPRHFSQIFRTSSNNSELIKNYKFKFIGQPQTQFHRNLSVTQHLCQQQPDGSKPAGNANDTDPVPVEKMGLVARFKHMYKQYWYVLLPVHVVTSAAWLGGFYYVSKR